MSGREIADAQLCELAKRVLKMCAAAHRRIATAESCTGGLLASLLTDVEGCSGAFERGFVTYTNEAKIEMLGIEEGLLANHSAVSQQVAVAMARGALQNSRADLAVSITGYAGDAEPGREEGLAYIALQGRNGEHMIRECHFGQRGRDANRRLAASAALEMLVGALGSSASA